MVSVLLVILLTTVIPTGQLGVAVHYQCSCGVALRHEQEFQCQHPVPANGMHYATFHRRLMILLVQYVVRS